MFGDQLPNRWNKVYRNLDNGLSFIFKGGFIFGDGLDFRLFLVVRKELPNPFFIPPLREFVLSHVRLRRRRRL